MCSHALHLELAHNRLTEREMVAERLGPVHLFTSSGCPIDHRSGPMPAYCTEAVELLASLPTAPTSVPICAFAAFASKCLDATH